MRMCTYWNKVGLAKSKTKQNKKIDSIGIGLASPEEIQRWSERRLPNGTLIGKVDKDHTVDYESLKPIEGGLFCERIFGPVEDFCCSCERRGKKNEKFCPNCEVEFTKSRVRRTRMGYIPLAVPVAHVWYLRGRPSYIANLIGKSRNAVDRLAYGETLCESFSGNTHSPFLLSTSCLALTTLPKMNPSEYAKQRTSYLRYGNKVGSTGMQSVLPKIVTAVIAGQAVKGMKTGFSYASLPNFFVDNRLPRKRSACTTSYSSTSTTPADPLPLYLVRGQQEVQLPPYAPFLPCCTYSVRNTGHPTVSYRVKLRYGSSTGMHYPYTLLAKLGVKVWKKHRAIQSIGIHYSRGGNVNFWTVLQVKGKQERWVRKVTGRLRSLRSKLRIASNLQNIEYTFCIPKVASLRYFLTKFKSIPIYNIQESLFKIFFVSSVIRKTTDTLDFFFTSLWGQSHPTYAMETKYSTHWGLQYRGTQNRVPASQILTKHGVEVPGILPTEAVLPADPLPLRGRSTGLAKQEVQQAPYFYPCTYPFGVHEVQLFHTVGRKKLGVRSQHNFHTIGRMPCTLYGVKHGIHFSESGRSDSGCKVSISRSKPNFLLVKKSSIFTYSHMPSSARSLFGYMRKITRLKELRVTHGVQPLKKKQNGQYQQNENKTSEKYNKYHTLPLFSTFVYKEWSHRFSFLEYFIWSAQKDDLKLLFYEQHFEITRNKSSATRKNSLNLVKNKFLLHVQSTTKNTPNIDSYAYQVQLKQSSSMLACNLKKQFFKGENKLSKDENVSQLKFPSKAWIPELPFAKGLYKKESQSVGFALATNTTRTTKMNIYTPCPTCTTEGGTGRTGDTGCKPLLPLPPLPPSVGQAGRGMLSSQQGLWDSLKKDNIPTSSEIKLIDTQQFPRLAELLCFTGGTALRHLLSRFHLVLLGKFLRHELKNLELKVNNLLALKTLTYSQGLLLGKLAKRRSKQIRRLKLLELFQSQKSNPEWMILSVLPVLPPDLRPILRVNDDFVVASDLNRLYQTVLRRNNTIHERMDDPLPCPESGLFRQRSLQKAVDGLLENGKGGGAPLCASKRRPLVSLSHVLKGKKGLFRQHLLGKRVDYSGRSVIVVGPRLNLHECGLPKEMAMELFQPFLLHRLKIKGFALSNTAARRLIQQEDPVIWHILKQLVYEHPVLLNRAPTLHRLGIQAFQPRLVSGRAILLHPLVCSGFNADFDGDQMAVHVPLSFQARAEAWKIMWSKNNFLSPATGQPILVPSQDMVLGCYYLSVSVPRVLSFLTANKTKIHSRDNQSLMNCTDFLHFPKGVSKNELYSQGGNPSIFHTASTKINTLPPAYQLGKPCTSPFVRTKYSTGHPTVRSTGMEAKLRYSQFPTNDPYVQSTAYIPELLSYRRQETVGCPVSVGKSRGTDEGGKLQGYALPPASSYLQYGKAVPRRGKYMGSTGLGTYSTQGGRNTGVHFSGGDTAYPLAAWFFSNNYVSGDARGEQEQEKSPIDSSFLSNSSYLRYGSEAKIAYYKKRSVEAIFRLRSKRRKTVETLYLHKNKGHYFSNLRDSLLAYFQGRLQTHTPFWVRVNQLSLRFPNKNIKSSVLETNISKICIPNLSVESKVSFFKKFPESYVENELAEELETRPPKIVKVVRTCCDFFGMPEIVKRQNNIACTTCTTEGGNGGNGANGGKEASQVFSNHANISNGKELTLLQPQYGSSQEVCTTLFQNFSHNIIIEGNDTLEAPLELRLSADGNLVKVLTTFQNHYNYNATIIDQCKEKSEKFLRYMRTTAGRVVLNKALFSL